MEKSFAWPVLLLMMHAFINGLLVVGQLRSVSKNCASKKFAWSLLMSERATPEQ